MGPHRHGYYMLSSIKWLVYPFEYSRYFTNSFSSNQKSFNEVLVKVNWCFLDEAPRIFEGNTLIDTATPISMLVISHLNSICNWYKNNTLVFFPTHLLFSLFISHPTLLYENCFFMCIVSPLTFWAMCSRTFHT